MASRQRLASVTMNEPATEDRLAVILPLRRPRDLEQLEVSIAELRRLLNDPVALITRARDLLDGSARALLMGLGPWSVIVPLRFAVFVALTLYGGVDLPGDLDNAIRDALATFLDQTDGLALIHYPRAS